LLLYPIGAGIGVVLILPVGSPVISGRWSPGWLVMGCALLLVAVFRYRNAWRGDTRESLRWVGALMGALLVAATMVGLSTQHVVEGRAQVRGSSVDRAIVQLAQARTIMNVLADNQGLLNLPAEQAVPLGATFQAAINQDIRIGQVWNPATTDVAPLPELAEVVRLLNLASLIQVAALEAQYGNLANPEPALAAEASAKTAQSSVLITVTLPEALDAAQRAIVATVGSRP
jgi:hypothetical protein